MMLSAMIIVAMAGQAPSETARDTSGPRARPAAMLMDVNGKVQVKSADGGPRAVALGNLLYPGETLIVPDDVAATVAILGLGVQETIKPGSSATIGAKGCAPPEAVLASRAQKPAVARTMKNVRPAGADGRKAGVVTRNAAEKAPPAVTPIDGSNETSDRPAIAWPAVKEARTYRVKLLSGGGSEPWRAETTEPHLDFPPGRPALHRGYVFRWEVTDQDFRPVAAGEFTVATESELKQLDELKGLDESGDRADRLAAALAYRRPAAYAEAIVAFERLARDLPGEPMIHQALEELHRQAGRVATPTAPTGH